MENNDKKEDSGGKSALHVFDTKEETPDRIPSSKIDLRDSHAIRRELASVYRDMRSGRIDPCDGTRLAYVLDMIRKAYETQVLQERLELLEITINYRKRIYEK